MVNTVSQLSLAAPLQLGCEGENSVINTKFNAYFKEHKYCAQRKKTGINFVLIKNPENNNWGTNNNVDEEKDSFSDNDFGTSEHTESWWLLKFYHYDFNLLVW